MKHNDHDNDGKLSCKEFVKSVTDLRLNMAENDIKSLFSGFDQKNTGFMEIAFFMCTFVPELADQRLQVVQDLVAALAPQNNPGVVSMTNIKKFYFPRGHPDFLKRKRPDYDIKDEFFMMLNTFLGLSGGIHEDIPSDIMVQFLEMVSNAYTNSDDFCDILIGSFRMDRICGQSMQGSSMRGDQSVAASDTNSVRRSGIQHPFGTAQDMPDSRISRPQTGHQTPQVYNGYGNHQAGDQQGRPQTAVQNSPAKPEQARGHRESHDSNKRSQKGVHNHAEEMPVHHDRNRNQADESHRGDFTPARSQVRGDRTPEDFYSPTSYDASVRGQPI